MTFIVQSLLTFRLESTCRLQRRRLTETTSGRDLQTYTHREGERERETETETETREQAEWRAERHTPVVDDCWRRSELTLFN